MGEEWTEASQDVFVDVITAQAHGVIIKECVYCITSLAVKAGSVCYDVGQEY